MTSTYTPNDSPFQSPVDSTHLVHWDETVMTPGDHARLYQQWLASQAMTTNAVPFTVYDAIAHWETLIAPSKAIMDKAFGINGEQPC